MTLAKSIEARLKLRHYALVTALATHRSVSKVADVLGVSQTTVTRALSDIEEIFQAPLFTRTGKGLEPTGAGEVVIARAWRALAENGSLACELDAIREGAQGRLVLGLLPYASNRVLDLAWQHLFSYQPRIAVMSVEDVTGNLIAALRERTLDCAICRFSQSGREDDDLEQVLLYHQQPRLVASKPSAAMLRKHPEVDIAKLSEMDWIFPPSGTPIRHVIDAIFSGAGRRSPLPVLEAYAVRSIASALRRMPRGITVLPDDIAQAVADHGAAEVLPQTLPWHLPPVGLAWMKNSPKHVIISELLKAIQFGLISDRR
ncbi:MAG: LysR family transcriptional regulator [Burkholderiaceae bacterium]|nr:LysR family transcriptional regulator [Burkholderiaceae bacterium]